jgi:uncharacterized protein (TIGR03382 family)
MAVTALATMGGIESVYAQACEPRPCNHPTNMQAELEDSTLECLELETRTFDCSCTGGVVLSNRCEDPLIPYNFEMDNGCARVSEDGEILETRECNQLDPGWRTTLLLSRLDLNEEFKGEERVYRGSLGDEDVVVLLTYDTEREEGPEPESSCSVASTSPTPAEDAPPTLAWILVALGGLMWRRTGRCDLT